MSKVPMTVDVDRLICSELEEMRKMFNNRDFSGIMGSVERCQHHATAMEEALYARTNWQDYLERKLKDLDDEDKEDYKKKDFLQDIRDRLNEKNSKYF